MDGINEMARAQSQQYGVLAIRLAIYAADQAPIQGHHADGAKP